MRNNGKMCCENQSLEIQNKTGPKTEPCGTPQVMWAEDDEKHYRTDHNFSPQKFAERAWMYGCICAQNIDVDKPFPISFHFLLHTGAGRSLHAMAS